MQHGMFMHAPSRTHAQHGMASAKLLVHLEILQLARNCLVPCTTAVCCIAAYHGGFWDMLELLLTWFRRNPYLGLGYA
jgi:hypothetical protein